MTIHKASHKNTLVRKLYWVPVLALLMFVLAYGHIEGMVIGFLAGAYVLYILSDVDGYVSYDDEKVTVARFDLAEAFSAKWSEVVVTRSGKRRFYVRKETDGGVESVRVEPEMFENPGQLRTLFARKAVMHENERKEREMQEVA